MARTIIKKYDHDELWAITVIVPEEVKAKPKGIRERIEEKETMLIHPVPIYEVWDTIASYNIVGSLCCFNLVFGPLFIWDEYDDGPYHIDPLDEDYLWETAHERTVQTSFENEPFRWRDVRKIDSWREIIDTEIEIREVKSVGTRNRYYWEEDSDSSDGTTGWIEGERIPAGGYPAQLTQYAIYTETGHAWGSLYLDFTLDDEWNQYPAGPIFLQYDYTTTSVHTTTIINYYPTDNPMDWYRHIYSTVDGQRVGQGVSVYSSSVVINQEDYEDYSHYCYIYSRNIWEYDTACYCVSESGYNDPPDWSIDPIAGYEGRTISCLSVPAYTINYYFNVDGTDYLIHSGPSSISFNSFYCDIFELGKGNLVYVYSWLENSGAGFTPLQYHYGMVWNGEHYQSEIFSDLINKTTDYRHRFTGKYDYPSKADPYGALGYF